MNPESKLDALLQKMTLAEKIGQMWQINGSCPEHEDLVRQGRVGSFLNLCDAETESYQPIANRYQRIAVEESRLGIPLIFGRDVIHGFRTIFPIPLGQAATFNPDLVERAAHAAAREARACGIHWTFAPMVDVARDPRWGRIAESCGEDPLLGEVMGAAMVRGFQGPDMGAPDRVAACAKHYVGYGAAEGGRDYNTTLIPENELRNVYLRPFHACVREGAATLMSAFNDLNGVPASGNAFTIRTILKGEWGFEGFVVSDWDSVTEMIMHGFCADEGDAACAGISAGVDMEMVSGSYVEFAEQLLSEGRLTTDQIDDAVRRILRIKSRLGLFDNPYFEQDQQSVLVNPDNLACAKQAALESCVLLENDGCLPIGSESVHSLAVIGPLADAADDQMGCWVVDGKPEDVVTPLAALRDACGNDIAITYAAGLVSCRSHDTTRIAAAVAAAEQADHAVLFLGEDKLLSGEAHSRACLELPGAQQQLLDAVARTGVPVTVAIMAGRPLVLDQVAQQANALLFAWHPGTMGGAALADLLIGRASPSGRLPAGFPQTAGQIPLYYAHRNTGRPAGDENRGAPLGTPLDPVGFVSNYLDADHRPRYPFGFGLTYSSFDYSAPMLSADTVRTGDVLSAAVTVTNSGDCAATETVQLYIRDLVGSVTRPVKELKDFRRITLKPGEQRTVEFAIHTDALAFYDRAMQYVTEPGRFHLWIAPHAGACGTNHATFAVEARG